MLQALVSVTNGSCVFVLVAWEQVPTRLPPSLPLGTNTRTVQTLSGKLLLGSCFLFSLFFHCLDHQFLIFLVSESLTPLKIITLSKALLY